MEGCLVYRASVNRQRSVSFNSLTSALLDSSASVLFLRQNDSCLLIMIIISRFKMVMQANDVELRIFIGNAFFPRC